MHSTLTCLARPLLPSYCLLLPKLLFFRMCQLSAKSTSTTAVGRGTLCYLTRKDGKEYIIKDHWVVGNTDDDILNEVVMLQKMQGVHGIPELVESSKVKLSSGEIDNTKIYQFEEEAHHRGILHRDCSLHNAMIEDVNGNGMLIDWEFAVAVTSNNKYALGGTVRHNSIHVATDPAASKKDLDP
ncbi:hypothetical protein BDR07DRAFT_1378415 [Suillus spraguei]|nr:hypothetical protein BDR07DRAFT_1378415 [Suillus spraguei]